jgi:anti-anti-sigma regulatory factor
MAIGDFSGGRQRMATKSQKRIALPAIIDLDAIDGIRDALGDALEEGPVTVAAGDVERVSTNALMLLLSAAETARSHTFEFAIEAPSAAMIAAIERLGLGTQFSRMMKQ